MRTSPNQLPRRGLRQQIRESAIDEDLGRRLQGSIDHRLRRQRDRTGDGIALRDSVTTFDPAATRIAS